MNKLLILLGCVLILLAVVLQVIPEDSKNKTISEDSLTLKPQNLEYVSRTEPNSELNIVLITIDALRKDHMGIYGYSRDTTPTIDGLAREGILFENAYTHTSWTVPSLASIITSLMPHQHNTTSSKTGLSREIPIFPEKLKQTGYTNAQFLSSAYALYNYGFNRSFDTYAYNAERPLRNDAWLKEHKDEKFFLWLHYGKPHGDYNPLRNKYNYDGLFIPEKFNKNLNYTKPWNKLECTQRMMYDRERADRIRVGFYDRCARYTDDEIKEFLDTLKKYGLTNNTLIIISTDHGEEFFDHGGCDHGKTFNEEVIQTPLIFYNKELFPNPVRIKPRVRQIDIAPTILDILKIDIPPTYQGVSLIPFIEGKEKTDQVVVGGILAHQPHAYFLIDGDYKYLSYPHREDEFYNLKEDPKEKNNLKDIEVELAQFYENRLIDIINNSDPDLKFVGEEIELDEAAIEKLRSYGYLV